MVFLEDDAAAHARLNYTIALAERWQAHVIATFVVDRLNLHPYNSFAVGSGLKAMLRQHRVEAERQQHRARRHFEDLASSRSVSHEWRVSEDEDSEALMLHARHASLAVIGPSVLQSESTSMLGVSEHVIFSSGRPSLLVPVNWPADRIDRRIVVGWNASREATRALADAMPILAEAGAVHLIAVREDMLVHRYGSEPGADIARHLAHHDIPVAVEQCDGGDAGHVLLERVRALDADMLVMGACERSRIGEVLFGSVTRTMLAQADVPILLSR
ncbi:universal stress protein [Marinivivus vitaminiproducens]|uniref:universal stress protein n=1 Tax=Marinivivus vitaminiproducens TaxID=3035935 RepID=UPI00279B4FC7|nr:universal stress protein [Geminicoccaceae bacterium SCSIO 64248]